MTWKELKKTGFFAVAFLAGAIIAAGYFYGQNQYLETVPSGQAIVHERDFPTGELSDWDAIGNFLDLNDELEASRKRSNREATTDSRICTASSLTDAFDKKCSRVILFLKTE